MSTTKPFDPFSFSFEDEDQYPHQSAVTATSKSAVSSPARSQAVRYATSVAASQSATAVTSKTTNTTEKNQELPPTNRVVALPPRLNVKLSLHEEVSSSAILDPDGGDGGLSMSQLFVEGKIMAQVTSSDASNNAPFCLQMSGAMISAADINYSDSCNLMNEDENQIFRGNDGGRNFKCKVSIPNAQVEPCEVMSYTMNVKTQNMPILVQSKAALNNQNKCRITVQIRSNLSNQGDLTNFVIVVAIPTSLHGSTLQVTRGAGTYDNIKRIVTWKLGTMPKGQSSLVSVEAELAPSISKLLNLSSALPDAITSSSNNKVIEEKVQFPVLVRCSSELDQISDLRLDALDLDDVPASIVLQQSRSFRLLHRVEK